MPVTLPVDHLPDLWPDSLRDPGLRLGALLHSASVTAQLEPTLGVLAGMDGDFFRISALFGPQHGFESTTQDNMVEWDGFTHAWLGIPVFSLYGEHREPIPGMLGHIDALFVDLDAETGVSRKAGVRNGIGDLLLGNVTFGAAIERDPQ